MKTSDPQFFARRQTFVTHRHAKYCARLHCVEIGRIFTHRIGIAAITPIQVQEILCKLRELVEEADLDMLSNVPSLILDIEAEIEEEMV